ncbi:MAG: spore coat protein U domain-containing protein [Massilia sp.]|nr:spore coat protein U domain-containing protein [Massilia sp.]
MINTETFIICYYINHNFATVTVLRVNMIHRKFIVLLSILSAIFVTSEAAAASSTSSMAVSATVLSACMVSVLPLSFGNDVAPGAARDASTTMTAACTSAGTPFTIRFDQGGGTDATMANGRTAGLDGTPANHPYYREAGRTTVWGNTAGTERMTQTTGASPTILTVHGRRLATQATPESADANIVNVTLTY